MRYHLLDYGLPKLKPIIGKLIYSEHAKERLVKRGINNPPKFIDTRKHTILEYDSERKIYQVVINDIYLVISSGKYVITVLPATNLFMAKKETFDKPPQPKIQKIEKKF